MEPFDDAAFAEIFLVHLFLSFREQLENARSSDFFIISGKTSKTPVSSTPEQQTSGSQFMTSDQLGTLRDTTSVTPAVATDTIRPDPIEERVRSKSSISRSVPDFLDISKEQEIGNYLTGLICDWLYRSTTF